jgi:hypothetical protein
MFSLAPSSLSTMVNIPTTFKEAFLQTFAAFKEDPPVVDTSSNIAHF